MRESKKSTESQNKNAENENMNVNNSAQNLNTLPGLDDLNSIPDNPVNSSMDFEPNNGMNENTNYAHNSVTNDMDFNYEPMQNANPDMNGQDLNQNQGFDPNMNMGYDMNQWFDMNPNQGYDPNMSPNYDMNQGFEMNQNQGYDPNMNQNYDMNQGFDMNQNQGYDPNMNQNYDMNQGFEMNQNQMDPNAAIYGQNQDFGMGEQNQNFGMNEPQNFNPNQINPDMQGFNQNQNMNPDMQNFNQNPMNPNMQNFNQNPMNAGNDQNSNTTSTMNPQEEEFTRKWMGAIYDKAQKSKFNWCAAFFQGYYMLYRKMYLTGALVILFEDVVCMLISLLISANPMIAAISMLLFTVLCFVGFGIGFYPLYKGNVKKEFKAAQANTTNQVDPSKKGGTSAIALAIGLIASILVMSIFNVVFAAKQFASNTKKTNTTNTTNVAVEPESLEEKYNFLDDYYFTYDSSEWTEDYAGNGLVNGNYTLSYKINYKAEDLNADFNSQESLQALLQLLTDSFTSQVAELNMQVEANGSNFIKQNNCYYAYIDVLGSDSISRYYFVASPLENLLFQFVLTESDTSIDYSTNLSVIDVITKIKVKSAIDDESLNTIGNTLSNEATMPNSASEAQTTEATTGTGSATSGATNSASSRTSTTESGVTTATNATTSGTTSSATRNSAAATTNTTSSSTGTNANLNNFINQ